MNITDLRPNPKNPRKISAQRDARLAEYLAEFGDLSGLIFNRDGTVISAHQRVRHYKRNGGQLVLVEQYDEPTKDGTIARGHIEMPDGTRYIVRQVDWDKEKAERAMIVANGSFGEWDTEVLLGHFDFDLSELIDFGVPETIFVDSKKEAPRETVEDDYEIPDVIKTDIKRGDLFEIGQHRLDNRFQLAVAMVHTKIILIETHCGLFITMRGSANLRSSATIEHIEIQESPEIFRFFADFHDEIVRKFKTINKDAKSPLHQKSLTKSEAWQSAATPTQTPTAAEAGESNESPHGVKHPQKVVAETSEQASGN